MPILREAESRYRAVFDAARDAMIVYTRDGVIVEANAAACSIYGYARDELIGVDAREAVHPDARPHFEEFLRVTGSGGEFRCETVDRRRDGTVFPIEVTGTCFSYDGQPHLMSVIRDITGRKQVEEQLRRSHATFYHLIQNNPFGVYVVDADFRLREVSLGAQKVFQHVPRPLLGRDFNEVLRTVWAEPFASEALARFRHTLATGEPYVAMRTVERRQDVAEVEAYDWRIERIVLPDGRFGVVCYFYDLSERQKWEAELAEARRRSDSALIAGEVGTFEWDVVADRLWGDRNFARIFNIERDGQGAFPLADYVAAIHADDRDAVVERVMRAVETGCDYEAEYRIATSVPPRWVIARGRVERDDAGRAVRFPGVVLDVTEQKRAEAALRESEQRRRLALDSAELGSWHVDPATMTLTTDERFRAIFGVSVDQLSYEQAVAVIHPDDQHRVREAVAAATRRDHPAPYAVEYRVVHPDGSLRWVFAKGRANSTGSGPQRRIVSFDGTLADITDRKRAEAERQALLDRERVARAEAERANEAKDRFLAVLSHELRTPLSPVVMTIAELEQHPALPDDVRESMSMVRRNIDLETRLIDDLLDLSRVTSGKLRLRMEQTSLHDVLRHAYEVSADDMNAKRLKIKFDFAATNDRVTGDPSRLQQVFWNLLKNAVKFSPEGGDIIVRTFDAAAGRVRVEVTDNGIGITPQALPHIFGAFEQGDARTTHRFGGLGLGLAISRAVVDMHGGTITATSKGTGKGATFTVEMDTTSIASVPARLREPPQKAFFEGEPWRVLLVEDHPDTARVMGRLLGHAGYLVTVAHSVASALKFAGAGPFDIVISDIGLPDASGHDLMRQLKTLYGMKGIALSGYGMEDDVRRGREAGFDDHVTKPVNLPQLQAAIQRVLAQSGSRAN